MPVRRPPVGAWFFTDHQLDVLWRSTHGSALTKSCHRKALQPSDSEVRIPFSIQFKGSIRTLDQAGLEAEVGAQTIERKGGADQLLIGSRNPRNGTVHIAQNVAVTVQHRDGPHTGLSSNISANGFGKGRTRSPRLKGWKRLLGLRRRRRNQRQALGAHRWGCQRQQ